MSLLLFIPSSHAATWTVGASGSTDFTTISEAVAAASEGDEIDIEPGEYSEDVDLGGVSLTLRGAGSSSTFVLGTGVAVDATGATTVALYGLGIRGGGRGIDATGALTLSDVTISGTGSASTPGGGIRQIGGSLTWTDGHVDGAAGSDGIVQLLDADASFDAVVFSDGVANVGGAILAERCTVSLTAVEFLRNESTHGGGALWVSESIVDAAAATFTLNSAGDDGGCVSGTESDISIMEGSFFACTTTGRGAAVYLDEGSLVVDETRFEESSGAVPVDILAVYADVALHDSEVVNPDVTGCDRSTGQMVSSIWIDSGPDNTLQVADITFEGLELVPPACLFDFYAQSVGEMVVGNVSLLSSGTASDHEPTVILSGDSAQIEGTIQLEAEDAFFAIGGTTLTASAVTCSGLGTLYFGGDGTVSGVDSSCSMLSLNGLHTGLAASDLSLHATDVQTSGPVTISDADIEDAGIIVGAGGSSSVVLDNVRIVNPHAAGVAVLSSSLTATSLSVVGGSGGYDGTWGGGLYAVDSEVNLSGAYFEGNSATYGGGIALDNASGSLESLVILRNQAPAGGGIWVSDGAPSFANVVLQENEATEGSAVYVASGTADLIQSTIVGNTSTGGAAIHIASGYPTFTNLIVAHNAGGPGFQADASSTASFAELEYNDAYDNAGGNYAGYFSDPTGTDGNIADDPLFVAYSNDGDATNDDLHLATGSPAIDAGYPFWYDDDGSRSDMGAYGGAYAADIDYDGDGTTSEEGDCNDSDAAATGGATETPYDGSDNDCDPGTLDDDLDADGYALVDDCDDTDAAVNPGVVDAPYDGIDADCAGDSDNDDDHDGFDLGLDCDDGNASINPGSAEIPYDAIDNDCAAGTPDDDLDADGYLLADDCDDENAAINPGSTEIPYDATDNDCDSATLDDDLDADGYLLADDCDDENSAINPGSTEMPYDATDNDCDSATLDDDLDADGYLLADDCDDENTSINPGSTEIPYDATDNDCDSATLDDDLDADGYLLADDCDDENTAINPGSTEVPYDGTDNDCAAGTPDDDLDGDGFLLAHDCDDTNAASNPAAAEACDGTDSDCDGLTDEDDPDAACDSGQPDDSGGDSGTAEDSGDTADSGDTGNDGAGKDPPGCDSGGCAASPGFALVSLGLLLAARRRAGVAATG